MSAKIKYTRYPLGRPKVVADFVPPPEDLVVREEGVKVTRAESLHKAERTRRKLIREKRRRVI